MVKHSTLSDVAEKAGVAVVTARKALRGDPSVRSYISTRVLEAARELDYQPNLMARALKIKSLNLVPISIISLNKPFFSELAVHLSLCLIQEGCEPMFCADLAHLMTIRRSLATCASVILSGDDHSCIHELCRVQKVVTIHSGLPPMKNFGDVWIDFTSAYQKAITVVLNRRRQRIAICSSYYANQIRAGRPTQKFDTVVDSVKQAGLQPVSPPDCIAFTSPVDVGLHLDRHPGSIDTVFCEDDMVASQLYGELASRGLRIPGDVMVIGCDALHMLKGTWSVQSSPYTIATKAMSLLLRLLRGDAITQPETYSPQLVDWQGCIIDE